mmetsp:Transcript_18762/g.29821  ORF Transcript_18762/g.29821 Transcript_18762/m.29821 type:complete len:394 (-) Transcript_18762:430-1611(-)
MNPVETPSRKNFKGSGLDFYSPRSASQTPSHGGGGHRRRWKNSSQAIDSMSPLSVGSMDASFDNGNSSGMIDSKSSHRRASTLFGSPQIHQSSKEDLDVPAFVIDNGSGFLKAGYGTEDRPQIYIAAVGEAKYKRVILGSRRLDKVIVGTQRIGRLRGALKLSYPTNAGVVSNWEHVQKLWENAYEEQRVSPRNHPLLMTEQPLCLMKHRITTAEILYETMEVPSMCFQLPQVLGLYAVGNTTGLMVDSGDTLSSAVPIFDGRYDPNTVCVTNLAGRDVTQYLSRLLRLAGWNMTSSSEMEEVKRIKQKQCATAFNLASALRDYEDTGIGYKLPDGRVIKIGLEKFEAPELMFQPSLMGKENPGIHELVCNAISKCKTEHRRHIARQVILTGL